jgi:hypothetical protein
MVRMEAQISETGWKKEYNIEKLKRFIFRGRTSSFWIKERRARVMEDTVRAADFLTTDEWEQINELKRRIQCSEDELDIKSYHDRIMYLFELAEERLQDYIDELAKSHNEQAATVL